jgi:predicted GNAT family acetyltransferase
VTAQCPFEVEGLQIGSKSNVEPAAVEHDAVDHPARNHPDVDHAISHDAQAQQLTATVEGRQSLLQYRREGDVLSIVHTEVPAELAGHGIGAELVRAAFEMARANGWRVRPACSYAAAYALKHPEYADLLA